MRQDVTNFVVRCLVCQKIKSSTQPQAGLLQTLLVPSQVWDDLTMDFVVALPNSHGFTVFMVVVDRLTKYAHFGALPTHFSASKLAELFANIVVKLHGFLSTIVSNRDRVFMSKFWNALFYLSGTTLKHRSSYHPQTDEQSEVVNRGLGQYLRAFA